MIFTAQPVLRIRICPTPNNFAGFKIIRIRIRPLACPVQSVCVQIHKTLVHKFLIFQKFFLCLLKFLKVNFVLMFLKKKFATFVCEVSLSFQPYCTLHDEPFAASQGSLCYMCCTVNNNFGAD